MLSICLKIFLSAIVLGLLFLCATQVRREADMRAVKWAVQHPPPLQWVLDHPKESLQRDRMEREYLYRLIADLDS
jgi:hypothetical protein